MDFDSTGIVESYGFFDTLRKKENLPLDYIKRNTIQMVSSRKEERQREKHSCVFFVFIWTTLHSINKLCKIGVTDRKWCIHSTEYWWLGSRQTTSVAPLTSFSLFEVMRTMWIRYSWNRLCAMTFTILRMFMTSMEFVVLFKSEYRMNLMKFRWIQLVSQKVMFKVHS